MRMHRKRNLEERAAACAPVLLARGKPCRNLKEAAENFRALAQFGAVFGNNRAVELEIGCGNGGFIFQKAQRNPEINYLAAELNTNVLITAMERILREGVSNVRFLNIPAEILECYIPQGSIERIYLNFSTPLPEKSRERQRLTSPRFLGIYRNLLKEGGEIVQKTDSRPFFEYSLASFRENGFAIRTCTYDLHNSEYAAENIVTQYEQKFTEQGASVCMAVAVRSRDGG